MVFGFAKPDRSKSQVDDAGRPRRGSATDVAGKIWNLPNTTGGLGYGLAGYVAGQAMRLLPGNQPDPRIGLGHNAIEFINNPLGGVGAITIGNTTTYRGDPYNRSDPWWVDPKHEEQHTYQGQLLGPAYIPSNAVGGIKAVLKEGDWHGRSNWNERGPKMSPPQPWPPGKLGR